MNRNVSGIFCLLLSLTVVLPSCKKDKLPSFKEQVTGHWKSSAVFINNTDVTAAYQYALSLEATHEFNLNLSTPLNGGSSTIYESGDWIENEAKNDLTLTFNSSGQVITYDVTIVSETQMTASFTQNGSLFQITFDRTQD